MRIHKKRNRFMAFFMTMVMVFAIPPQVSGEVKQINDIEDRLENISEEEKEILENLFMLSREIDGLKKEETRITGEINALADKIVVFEKEINNNQESYNLQLDILTKVLVNNQRRGSASYLEILLDAKNLSEFLKSLNIMKDISYNVNHLLESLSESKTQLEEERGRLADEMNSLEQRKLELAVNLSSKQNLTDELESYLTSLQTDRENYQKRLDNMSQLWEECKTLFSETSARISEIISQGYFNFEDLNLEMGFLSMKGRMNEAAFNRAFSDNEMPTAILFDFKEGRVVLEAPQEHLVLSGNFVISGKSAISFEVAEGSFYGMSLEKASLDELFENGPLMLDFETMAAGGITLDFKMKDIGTTEDALHFVVVLQF